MIWLLARFYCWRKGHDWRLMTADLRFADCLGCAKQVYTSASMRAELAPFDDELDELLAGEEAVSDA